jgi:hypothetical protein
MSNLSLYANGSINVSIETQTIDNDNMRVSGKDCTICMEPIETSVYTKLNCCHDFHTDCYTTYITHKILNNKEYIECPNCRDPILQVIVHNPTTFHIITNGNDGDGQSDDLEDHSNEWENSTRCCCLPPPHILVFNLLRMGLIGCMLLISILSMHCGMGHQNVLCPSDY